MVSVLTQYIGSGLGKFLASVYIQYMIIYTLDVSEYAYYGLVNSLVMLVGLLLTFNSETAFQRMYASERIRGMVNAAFLVLFTLIICIFSISFLVFKILIDLTNINFGIEDTISVNGFILLCISLTLYNILISLINALKITHIYVLLNVLPNFIVALIITIRSDFNLTQLLNIISTSHLIVIFLMTILHYKTIKNSPLNFLRLKFFLTYIISYTKHSFHTIGTKYVLDLTLRALLLDRFGATVLASYNLSGAVLGVFRSVEQNITKAITPSFLSFKLKRERLLTGAKFILASQTGITVIIFSMSIFWYPLLGQYFPNKPAAIFNPNILMVLALITIIGYWKNYFIIILKQKWQTMKLLYLQTSFFNVLSFILLYVLGLNIYIVFFILVTCQISNLFVLSRITKNYYD